MNDVALRIADVDVGFLLPTSVALPTSLVGFRGDKATRRFIVRGTELDAAPEQETPHIVELKPQLTIVAPSSFTLSLNSETGAGSINYNRMRNDGLPDQLPACLTSALKSLFAVLITDGGGLVLHASSVVIDGEAVLFAGPSGSGKSTVAAMFGADAVLNDELIAVTWPAGTPRVHSTPFSGTLDAPRARRHAPFRMGFFIRHGSSATVHRLGSVDAVSRLLACTVLPRGDGGLEARAFAAVTKLVESGTWHVLEASLNSSDTISAVTAALHGTAH